jgi:hypothetical protein
LSRKRPRIGIVPRLTLGTAAAVSVIPACVAMSCSSGNSQEPNCGSSCPDVAAAFDSSYQGGDVLASFDVTASFEAGPRDDAGTDADDAMSGDGGLPQDGRATDGATSDAATDGGE